MLGSVAPGSGADIGPNWLVGEATLQLRIASRRGRKETIALWFDGGSLIVQPPDIHDMLQPRRLRKGRLIVPWRSCERGTFPALCRLWIPLGSAILATAALLTRCAPNILDARSQSIAHRMGWITLA